MAGNGTAWRMGMVVGEVAGEEGGEPGFSRRSRVHGSKRGTREQLYGVPVEVQLAY